MLGNKRRDTAPELRLRRELHRLGCRYRIDMRPLPELGRRADVVFRPAKVAVYLMGCFWHGCPDHYSAPKNNAAYWSTKVDRNRVRDADTLSRLAAAGWVGVVVWEHDDPVKAAERIKHLVRDRTSAR